MKAHRNCKEWLYEIENYSLRIERMHWEIEHGGAEAATKWVKEAWKQSKRTARVQEQILLGEIKKLKEEIDALREGKE